MSQIIEQINSQQTQKVHSDFKYDIINQFGEEIDYIAQPFGLERQVYTQYDSDMVIDNCVIFRSKDQQQSILKILQLIYGDSENFPDVVYVRSGDIVLKVLTNYKSLSGLDTTQQIYQQQIEQYDLTRISGGDTLEFTYGFEQLNEFLVVKSLRYISDFFGYEPDEHFKARVQQKLQGSPTPTLNYIDQMVRSKLSNVRHTYSKVFARGLSTVDIILFPPITSLYDENNNLKVTQSLAQVVQRDIDDIQPLGIDILAVDATQIPLDFIVTQQDNTMKETIEQIIKNAIINYVNSIIVGQEYTFNQQQIIDNLNNQLQANSIIQKVTQLTINHNDAPLTEPIKDSEYPVVNSVSLIWS